MGRSFTRRRELLVFVSFNGNRIEDPERGYDNRLKTAEGARDLIFGRTKALLLAVGRRCEVMLHVPGGVKAGHPKLTAALDPSIPEPVKEACVSLRDFADLDGHWFTPYVGWPANPFNAASIETEGTDGQRWSPVELQPEIRDQWIDGQYRDWVKDRVAVDELSDLTTPAPQWGKALERACWCDVVGEALPLLPVGDRSDRKGYGKVFEFDSARINERPWMVLWDELLRCDPDRKLRAPMDSELTVIISPWYFRTNGKFDRSAMIAAAKDLVASGFRLGIGADTPTNLAAQLRNISGAYS